MAVMLSLPDGEAVIRLVGAFGRALEPVARSRLTARDR
jgi:hypothetical protein